MGHVSAIQRFTSTIPHNLYNQSAHPKKVAVKRPIFISMCYSITLRKEERDVTKRFRARMAIELEFTPYHHLNGFTHDNLYIVPMDSPDEILQDLHEPGIKELMKSAFTTKEIDAYPVSRDLYKQGVDTDNSLSIDKVSYPKLNQQDTLF